MSTIDLTGICDCGHDGYEGHDMRQSPPECMTPGCICGLFGATANGSTVHRVGRWVVRIAPAQADLFHGLDNDWSRDRASYETGTIVEVYDSKYTGEGFTPLGQFVGAWGASTLLDHNGPRGGLVLHGGIPEWTMTSDEFTTLLGLIVRNG